MDVGIVKTEYTFEYNQNKIIVAVEHDSDSRQVNVFFNGKCVKQSHIQIDSNTSDAECIHLVTQDFIKSTVDKYTDIVKNHSDRIYLISKHTRLCCENWGITALMSAHITKGNYLLRVEISDTGDYIESSIKANNFSEALEKMRLCSSFISGLSSEFTAHFDQMSTDRLLDAFQWKEE